jgi:hypothetical protein
VTPWIPTSPNLDYANCADMGSLLNLKDYTGLELGIYLIGAYLWVVAYLIYVRNGFKYHVMEMPAFALAGNIGWELNWALFFKADLGPLCVWAHKAWFFIDVIMFYLLIKHGKKQTDVPWIQRFWMPICWFLFACFAALYHTFVTQGLDLPNGALSAYIGQLPISFLYIPLMLRQKSLVGWSLWAAWSRTLGTGIIGVWVFLHYTYSHFPFLLTIAVISTSVDFTYIRLFTVRRRELARESTA